VGVGVNIWGEFVIFAFESLKLGIAYKIESFEKVVFRPFFLAKKDQKAKAVCYGNVWINGQSASSFGSVLR